MATNPLTNQELRRRFQYHPPVTEDDMTGHASVREELHAVAQTLNATLPDGREKSLVMTKLEEAMMWANAALARARA